jgi:hypothetical protein
MTWLISGGVTKLEYLLETRFTHTALLSRRRQLAQTRALELWTNVTLKLSHPV